MIIGEEHQKRRVTPEQVAELLPVSETTAYRYCKKGKMPACAYELIKLKLSGRVIPSDEEWKGFIFNESGLLWSDTGFNFDPYALNQHRMMMSIADDLRIENKQLKEYIQYLEDVKPRAPVVKFPKEKTSPSLTEGKETNSLFEKS